MSRPPHARESVLDAFAAILIDEGERAATMDATARAAGVSKGGLLYHFGSKDALESGVIERLDALVTDDIDTMAPGRGGSDRLLPALLRHGERSPRPRDPRDLTARAGRQRLGEPALRDVRERWGDALRPHTKDAASLDLVMLVSDGLYFNNALAGGSIPGPVPRGAEMDALIALVERAARR